MSDRLFIGCYPTGLVYADRHVEEHGDYKRAAYLNYGTLELEMEDDVPASLKEEIEAHVGRVQSKRGQYYSIAGNCSVILGSNINDGKTFWTRHGENCYVNGNKMCAFKTGDAPFTWEPLPSSNVTQAEFEAVLEAYVRQGIDQHSYEGGFDEATAASKPPS